MTQQEREKIDELVLRLRVIIAAPEFGTPEQAEDIEDIADKLELLIRG